ATPIPPAPFFGWRTPARNYGPGRLPGGRTITPLARRLAAEAGIDLAKVSPSGPHGRIVARDIAAPRAKPTAPMARGPAAEEIKALYRDAPFEEIPLDGMRRTIAARLMQRKQTTRLSYRPADVEIGRLLKRREEVNAAPDFKLSVNDLIIKAGAAALHRVPAANAIWVEDRILRFEHSDIAVAVAIEGGLIAPVIRKAETKTLSAIAREMKE